MESKGIQGVFSGSTIYALKFLQQPGKRDHFACPKNARPDKKAFVRSCSMLFHEVFTKFK